MQIRCPHCQNPIEVVQDDESFDYDCPSCGSSFNLAADTKTVSHTVDEAAATIAIFNGLVRSADAIGIPLDDVVMGSTADHRSALGINDYAGASQSRAAGVCLRPSSPALT